MLKRRNKEDGFTLVELMIVIAVIGILAVVLIPRLGGVKDSAKYAGVTTNAKSVEAYVIANIDRWNKNGLNAEELIKTQFTDNDPLENPFTQTSGEGNAITFSESADAFSESPVANVKGIILVIVEDDLDDGIQIIGYGDSTKDVVYQSKITPDGKVVVGDEGSGTDESGD